ncbi:TldD/PmbA family protein [Desulforudis sp. DRI-14]|uniref:TldD/PmbA family protein n=1 Tax=Desulforudis sp. DRI-14 TaxID=3459793 RepID=UPI0040426680
MVDEQLLKEVLDLALSNGGDFADIFVENRRITGISCEDNKIERVQTGLDAGAGIRVLAGEATAYAYTNQLDRQGLLDAAGVVARAAGSSRKDVNIDLNRLEPAISFDIERLPNEVETEDKVEVVQKVNQAARGVDAEKIKQVIVGYGDVIQHVQIANSEGVLVEDTRVRTRLVVNAVAADGGVIQTGYDALGGVAGFELVDSAYPEEMARKAAGRAVALLAAQPAPSGKMPVILASEAGGTMVHEACGHGLEADLVQKELSVYAGKRGEVVASPLITVFDDSTMPGKYGSYAFDDEGTGSAPVTLIEEGVLRDYLYDRLTAGKEGRRSNGHGRRESYQHKPIPRMGNTCIAPGKEDPRDILREAKRGLLVRKMGGGQVNTTNGDFVFEVAEGYLIEDGDVGSMVRGATLTGNGPEVLAKVERVGKDLGFTIGTCGKDGQGVPVSDAQPTMSFGQQQECPIVVGGTGGSPGGSGANKKDFRELMREPRIRRL